MKNTKEENEALAWLRGGCNPCRKTADMFGTPPRLPAVKKKPEEPPSPVALERCQEILGQLKGKK